MKIRCIATVLTIASVFLIFPTLSQAEEGWYLRAKGGWTNAGFYAGEKLLGDHSRNAFNIGAAVELIVDENLGVDFGVAYVQKGAEGTITMEAVEPDNPDVFEGTAKLDYVVLSANALIFMDVSQQSQARIYLGPGIGILVNSKAEGTLNGSEIERELGAGLKDWEFLATVGANFTYDFGKVAAFLDFRTEFGLSEIDNSKSDPQLKTRVSMLTLGFRIPLALYE